MLEIVVFLPRKFKGGIGSLFDPVLTLWGGSHIGSSRMEQSYCTSGFFRQRVIARNHSNYQPRPKRRSIIAYGKRENARRNKVRRSVRYVFLAVLRFPNSPGKGTAIFPFFSCFVLFVCVGGGRGCGGVCYFHGLNVVIDMSYP